MYSTRSGVDLVSRIVLHLKQASPLCRRSKPRATFPVRPLPPRTLASHPPPNQGFFAPPRATTSSCRRRCSPRAPSCTSRVVRTAQQRIRAVRPTRSLLPATLTRDLTMSATPWTSRARTQQVPPRPHPHPHPFTNRTAHVRSHLRIRCPGDIIRTLSRTSSSFSRISINHTALTSNISLTPTAPTMPRSLRLART